MKKVIFPGFGVTLPMLAITLISHGQATNTDLAFTKNNVSKEASVSKVAGSSLNRSTVTSKARKNFEMSYKNVSDEKWFNEPGGLVAMFRINDIEHHVFYDKKGGWCNTIRAYDENKLPPDVRHAVRSTYYDYSINLVQEIQTPLSPTTYVIQLIGKTDIISLRMCEGEMTVLKTFTKSE